MVLQIMNKNINHPNGSFYLHDTHNTLVPVNYVSWEATE